MGWVVNTTSRPLYPRKRSGTHCIGGWVDPRAGLDRCGKSPPPTGIRSPGRPARSESLYRLRYPGPPLHVPHINKSLSNVLHLYYILICPRNYVDIGTPYKSEVVFPDMASDYIFYCMKVAHFMGLVSVGKHAQQ